jgi:hypothetical protein
MYVAPRKIWHTRGRYYYHNYLIFLPIFVEQIGVFLKNQCNEQFFAKTNICLNKKRHLFCLNFWRINSKNRNIGPNFFFQHLSLKLFRGQKSDPFNKRIPFFDETHFVKSAPEHFRGQKSQTDSTRELIFRGKAFCRIGP